jgi:hypothetical protein
VNSLPTRFEIGLITPANDSNIELEQALLGAVLVNNEAFHLVSNFLRPEHFFKPIHQEIFGALRLLIGEHLLFTPEDVVELLQVAPDAGSINYLARLAAEATTIIDVVDYGRRVLDLAANRFPLIALCARLADIARVVPTEVLQFRSQSEGQIKEASYRHSREPIDAAACKELDGLIDDVNRVSKRLERFELARTRRKGRRAGELFQPLEERFIDPVEEAAGGVARGLCLVEGNVVEGDDLAWISTGRNLTNTVSAQSSV